MLSVVKIPGSDLKVNTKDMQKQVVPNTTSATTAVNPNTTSAQVQSMQRTATPPKMKQLHNECLIQCNAM